MAYVGDGKGETDEAGVMNEGCRVKKFVGE